MYNHPCHPTDAVVVDCDCGFSVWAPGTADKCFVNDAFNLYAMEIERNRQIDEFITCLSQVNDPNDPFQQRAVADTVGIWEFTTDEQKYIEEKVGQKWLANHL